MKNTTAHFKHIIHNDISSTVYSEPYFAIRPFEQEALVGLRITGCEMIRREIVEKLYVPLVGRVYEELTGE